MWLSPGCRCWETSGAAHAPGHTGQEKPVLLPQKNSVLATEKKVSPPREGTSQPMLPVVLDFVHRSALFL